MNDHNVLNRLQRLVHIESPSLDAAASAEIAAVLREEFEAVGARVTLEATPVGTNLLAEVDGSGSDGSDDGSYSGTGDGTGDGSGSGSDGTGGEDAPVAPDAPLLFVGHTDTVWPRDTLADALPWAVNGDTVRGPGVYDMKAGIVVMLEALRLVYDVPHRPVRVALVCDEEVGSGASREFLLRAARGVSAVFGFESPHPDGALKVGRRGSTRVELTVTGRAAHAALDPEAGISAIDELVDLLMRVREFTSNPFFETPVLCNVGTISGGGRANVVPAHAHAEIGLRFADAETEAMVLDDIRRMKPRREGAQVTITEPSHRPTWQPSAADATLLARVVEDARALGQELSGRPAAGAGDTNLFGALGVPTLDGFGPRGGGAHALTEHASLASLHERILLVARLLRR